MARQHAGDIDGMLALYEPDAVLDCGEGARGEQAIHAVFAEFTDAGRKFAGGTQRPALIRGDLALTSTRMPDGAVTTEIARRQQDATWVIDRFSVSWT